MLPVGLASAMKDGRELIADQLGTFPSRFIIDKVECRVAPQRQVPHHNRRPWPLRRLLLRPALQQPPVTLRVPLQKCLILLEFTLVGEQTLPHKAAPETSTVRALPPPPTSSHCLLASPRRMGRPSGGSSATNDEDSWWPPTKIPAAAGKSWRT